MNIISDIRSPNFSDSYVSVQFIVLHYTAASLTRTLEIFSSPHTEVSAHLVIDVDGSVYELVPCLSGASKRAWHAGRSRLELPIGENKPVVIEGFNDHSIGIELVNLNGNIFKYTEKQYTSLFSIVDRLKGLYPALANPESIVGHEQIAGFRGKADPGRCFEWERLFSVCYPNQGAPPRNLVCSEQLAERMRALTQGLGVYQDANGTVSCPNTLPNDFFGLLSGFLEVALAHGARK